MTTMLMAMLMFSAEGSREDNGGKNYYDNFLWRWCGSGTEVVWKAPSWGHEKNTENILAQKNFWVMIKNSQVCYQQLTAIANNVSDWSRVKLE